MAIGLGDSVILLLQHGFGIGQVKKNTHCILTLTLRQSL